MKHAAILAVCAGLLSACSGNTVKDTLGLSREAPDEFRVVSRPPLAVPPQFSLRPPDMTGQAPGALPADRQAQSMVLGTDPGSQDNVFPLDSANSLPVPGAEPVPESAGSAAEAALLRKAGATQADPDVRRQIVEENVSRQQVEEESSWWDTLSTTPPKKDPTVNAKKESERLKKNEEEGKPVTEGETPEVKSRDTGVLGRILGY